MGMEEEGISPRHSTFLPMSRHWKGFLLGDVVAIFVIYDNKQKDWSSHKSHRLPFDDAVDFVDMRIGFIHVRFGVTAAIQADT